jgi:hypothetical protein
VYFLATGSPPIDPHGPLSELGGFRTKLDSISADAHGHPHRGGYSEALQAVLYEILLVDPDMRIGAVKLLENLQQLYIDALNMCKKDEVTTNNDFYPDLPRVIQRLAERLAEEDEDDSDTEMDTDEDEDCSTSWLWMYRPSKWFTRFRKTD